MDEYIALRTLDPKSAVEQSDRVPWWPVYREHDDECVGKLQLFISTSSELGLGKWGRLSRFGGCYESAPFWTAKTTIVWVLAMEFTVLRCFSHLYQTRYAFDVTMESFRDESEPKRQEVLKSNFPSFWLLFLRIILTRHRLPVISFSRHLVSLHRSSCLEVIPKRCLRLSRTPARKRCKRLMAETDGFVATTSDGFLVDQRMPLNEKSQRFLRTWISTTNMYFRASIMWRFAIGSPCRKVRSRTFVFMEYCGGHGTAPLLKRL
ncbi:uncharacterized protein LOC112349303 [Selaginella moellendorffii]|uniref:uncharacterized protein LOC112349303 n=1 Tax=Selaginella moellendorffii TaxID=88036 RepID=UPI000D1C6ADB|nr:uncharacterized protein LOC112349303 [Selaginella moellendorffii]|eukprot:XP_024539307.1 uncharacterized protein LOC112349303 [Selaginella moellendorffii]